MFMFIDIDQIKTRLCIDLSDDDCTEYLFAERLLESATNTDK